ncbi:MAG: hypothetical protein KatS3mg060_2444 [Dehalococcoidia bacterium]|nr:MAG: hypothetical protein KatS3mg060_2444 [Dehalococcoidia bacterium]
MVSRSVDSPPAAWQPPNWEAAAASIESLGTAFDRLAGCARVVMDVDAAGLWTETAARPIVRAVGPVSPDLIQHIGRQMVALGASAGAEATRSAVDVTTLGSVGDAGFATAAAVPLVVGESTVIGAFCVFALAPRSWGEQESAILQGLAKAAVSEILLRETMACAEDRRSRMLRMLDRITDGFVAIDRAWRFVHVNPSAERLMGHSLDEVVGRDIWEVFPEAMATLFGPAVLRAAETGEAIVVEDQVPFSGRWLEARIFPSADGLTVYLHDTTERVLAAREHEARVVAEARLDGVILASREAAHLLNNDIALPMGLIELIQLDPGLSERSRAMLAEISGGLEQLHEHIRRFQAIVRVETKETPIGPALDLSRSSSAGTRAYAGVSASISSK